MFVLKSGVTKASQLEIGALYRIVGHSRSGKPIPPQMFRVETPVLRTTWLKMPYVIGFFWWNGGEHIGYRWKPRAKLYLPDIGIYETGYSDIDWYLKMAEVRDNDRHLERIDDNLARALGLLKTNSAYTGYDGHNGQARRHHAR